MQISYVNNNPHLTDEEKEYRCQEIMKSRHMGSGTSAGGNTVKGQFSHGNKTTPMYVDLEFVPEIGFVERINVTKLTKHIKNLQVWMDRRYPL